MCILWDSDTRASHPHTHKHQQFFMANKRKWRRNGWKTEPSSNIRKLGTTFQEYYDGTGGGGAGTPMNFCVAVAVWANGCWLRGLFVVNNNNGNVIPFKSFSENSIGELKREQRPQERRGIPATSLYAPHYGLSVGCICG